MIDIESEYLCYRLTHLVISGCMIVKFKHFKIESEDVFHDFVGVIADKLLPVYEFEIDKND